jgi:hypothetical protein
MSVSTEPDPLDATLPPDRVAYAVGALLSVDDFTDEQTYHRGRLARALAFLAGSGTVAGLKVDYQGPRGPDEEIVVHPGMAIDRLGRIIEMPRDACIHLDTWYNEMAGSPQGVSDLVQGFHAAAGGVIVDVFLRFIACDRALTPAFATGPFDATDYVSPSRVRDGYKLDLVVRKEGNPALPVNPWPDLAAEPDLGKRHTALHTAIFESWNAPEHQRDGSGKLVPLAEHAAGQDTTAIFLARFVIPATAGAPPLRTVGPITPDNESRGFAYPAAALARWLGI